MVNEETTEKITNMVINQVSLGTGAIHVSINDNFGLALESNINVSNKFDTEMAGIMKTEHNIMRVGTSVYKNSLAINHKTVQEGWLIHHSVSNNTVECRTQIGIRMFSHIHLS